MRDRLIELLRQGEREFADKYTGNVMMHIDKLYGVISDYLLANGVIVPPCKVGDVVYQVTRTFISEFRVRFIEIATCGNMFLHTDLIKGIVYTGEVFSDSEIGKTVFLTKEEAEAALVNYESSKGGAE